MKTIQIIQRRNIFYAVSIVFLLASAFFIFKFGLKLGIDFRGGTLIEVSGEGLSESDIKDNLGELNLDSLSVQVAENNSFIIRFSSDDDQQNQLVQEEIKSLGEEISINRVEFISSVISDELKKKAIIAVIIASIAIALYIAWAFRKVSYPVESWKYGVAALISLMHNIVITVGFFAFFGWKYGTEINTPFIAALLTILGYSINDTIVVFDRIRENLNKAGAKKDFENTVNRSINETLARSINTSLTVAMVLVAIILFGGESIKDFSLALLIGIAFGAYSSIFIASPLLVSIYFYKNKRLK
ncbi:MAG TPA: protein translocase subunit SecF [Candidatus Moranbacteria bacterium]|nr:protein translocase subunit SecF [Candidatus Moranbacteria bacterium]